MVGPGQGRDGVITCRIQSSFGVEAEDSRATGALAVRQVQVTDAAEGPTGLLPTLQQGPANLPQHLHAMGTASSPAPTSPPSTPPLWDRVATGVEPLALAEALGTPSHPPPQIALLQDWASQRSWLGISVEEPKGLGDAGAGQGVQAAGTGWHSAGFLQGWTSLLPQA